MWESVCLRNVEILIILMLLKCSSRWLLVKNPSRWNVLSVKNSCRWKETCRWNVCSQWKIHVGEMACRRKISCQWKISVGEMSCWRNGIGEMSCQCSRWRWIVIDLRPRKHISNRSNGKYIDIRSNGVTIGQKIMNEL